MTYRPRPISDSQVAFIRSLVTERAQAISAMPDDERAGLLCQPQTTRDASRLIDRLRAIPADPKQADSGAQARIDGLVAVLDQLDASDRVFASDLVRTFRRRGDLSERQWPWVDKLTVQASAPKAEPGLYILPDTTIVRIGYYEGRLVARRLVTVTGADGKDRGSFRSDRSLLSRVPTEGRPLTEDEARAFGKQHEFCCACALDLDDDRSLAVGYGPVCAKKYGWFYPTAKQASEILNRPTDLVTSCDTH